MKQRKAVRERFLGSEKVGFGQKLSLCMIVRDEAQNLPPCLNSIKPAVDEIVIVDTGSTDSTKEIARSLGARVYDFPWCNDFSAARNESIRHATGDYILWLDADDRIDPPELEKLIRLKKILPPTKSQAYYLVVNSQSPVDGETLFLQMRIFPRVDGARFEGRIHEQIFHVLAKLGIKFVQTDIVIRHTGYLDPLTMRKKSERNLALIERELESNPDNPVLHYNAARTLSGLGRLDEAIEHMQRIRESASIRQREKRFWFEASILLGKYYTDCGKLEEAISTFKEVTREFTDSTLAQFCLGVALFLNGKCDEARQALEKSLEKPFEVGLFPINIKGLCYNQHYILGECYARTGEFSRAKEMFLKSLEFQADHSRSLEALGLLALKNGNFEEATAYYQRALNEGCTSDTVYANLGLSLKKLGRLEDAERALGNALEINPRRIEALTNLGHMCWKRKDYPKARNFFEKALEIDSELIDVRLALSDIYFRLGEIERLVEQCDYLLEKLHFPGDMTVGSIEEMSHPYDWIGNKLLESGRAELALLAFLVALLIDPSTSRFEKVVQIGKSHRILDVFISDIEDVLRFREGISKKGITTSDTAADPV